MMTAKSDKCTQKPHRKLFANAQVMEPKAKETDRGAQIEREVGNPRGICSAAVQLNSTDGKT